MLALLLAARAHARSLAYLPIDGYLGLRVPAADDGSHAKRPHGGVERVCLHVRAHAVGERGDGDRRLVEAPPLGCFVAGARDEVAAVGEEARRYLEGYALSVVRLNVWIDGRDDVMLGQSNVVLNRIFQTGITV